MLAGSAAIFVACAAEQAATRSGASDSGVADAIGVLDAKAGPTPPSTTVDVVTCVGGVAEKAYPGRTKEDLVRTSVMLCGQPLVDPLPARGYTCVVAGIAVKDGSVAAYCNTAKEATFVAPPPL